ncbi:MAG TPA: hypothetical protein VIF43_00735 [Patescibacteria group bacterium]|jgi:hypothetical protein
MAPEEQSDAESPVDRVLVSHAAERAWEDAHIAWSDALQGDKGETVRESLGVCVEHAPGLLRKVLEQGVALERPLAEQRAFARQLDLLAEHDPRSAEALYRDIVMRDGGKPTVVTAALEGVGEIKEIHLETFAMMIAITLSKFAEGSIEWKRARSLLFGGSHSGQAAVDPITEGLRSEREDIRRLTARWLLPELAKKKQLGTTILDLIEERLEVDRDPVTARHCVEQLPAVFGRRPGQARRIVTKAWHYPDPTGAEAVRDALVRGMHRAGMADKLPVE